MVNFQCQFCGHCIIFVCNVVNLQFGFCDLKRHFFMFFAYFCSIFKIFAGFLRIFFGFFDFFATFSRILTCLIRHHSAFFRVIAKTVFHFPLKFFWNFENFFKKTTFFLDNLFLKANLIFTKKVFKNFLIFKMTYFLKGKTHYDF